MAGASLVFLDGAMPSHRTFLLGAMSVRLSCRYVISRFTDTKYFRWASLFMMWATFFEEIRSRPVGTSKGRIDIEGLHVTSAFTYLGHINHEVATANVYNSGSSLACGSVVPTMVRDKTNHAL